MSKIEGPTLYAILEEGNEFPKWLTEWSNGCVKIPLTLRKSGPSISDPKVYQQLLDIILKTSAENVYVFNFNEKYIGRDKTYYFYLSDVYVTNILNDDDKFVIGFYLKSKVKQTKNVKKRNDYMKEMFISYEIICPIIQGL